MAVCVCVTHGLAHIRDIVVTSFSLLLLKLDRYSPDRTLLDATHQVSYESTWTRCALIKNKQNNFPFRLPSPSYLVSEPLAGDYGDVLAHALVSVEIMRKASVVLLYDYSRRLFDGFRSHTTLGKRRRVAQLRNLSLHSLNI